MYFKQSDNVNDEVLDLHNLRKLVIDYCLFDSPAVLNKIPKNILEDLVFTFEPFDETLYQGFFNQQRRIRMLEMFENDKIAFDHLELVKY